MRKIKVLAKKVGEELKLVEFEHSLENMQKLVGGHLEVVSLPMDIDMWLHGEGLLEGLNLNVVTYMNGKQWHQIVGNIMFSGHDEEGNTISLTEEQMEWLKTYTIHAGTVDYKDGRKSNKVDAIICDA